MRLKTYLYSLKSSFSRVIYYYDVLRAPFAFSLKFFLFSYFILGILFSLKFNFITSQKIINFFNLLEQKIISHYPYNLSLNYQNGEMVSKFLDNSNQKDTLQQEIILDNLTFNQSKTQLSILIDTKNSYSLESLDKQDKISDNLIIASKAIYVQNSGIWTESSYQNLFYQVNNFSITGENLPMHLTSLRTYLIQGLNIFKVIIFFLAPLFLIGSNLLLILDFLLLYFLVRINFHKFKFIKFIQVSLHTLVISELLNFIYHLFASDASFDIKSIAYWVITAYIFISLKLQIQVRRIA